MCIYEYVMRLCVLIGWLDSCHVVQHAHFSTTPYKLGAKSNAMMHNEQRMIVMIICRRTQMQANTHVAAPHKQIHLIMYMNRVCVHETYTYGQTTMGQN